MLPKYKTKKYVECSHPTNSEHTPPMRNVGQYSKIKTKTKKTTDCAEERDINNFVMLTTVSIQDLQDVYEGCWRCWVHRNMLLGLYHVQIGDKHGNDSVKTLPPLGLWLRSVPSSCVYILVECPFTKGPANTSKERRSSSRVMKPIQDRTGIIEKYSFVPPH